MIFIICECFRCLHFEAMETVQLCLAVLTSLTEVSCNFNKQQALGVILECSLRCLEFSLLKTQNPEAVHAAYYLDEYFCPI